VCEREEYYDEEFSFQRVKTKTKFFEKKICIKSFFPDSYREFCNKVVATWGIKAVRIIHEFDIFRF
jgi:hypothetical protein